MAGSIFINSCIFNHAPVVHTSESQLGSMSGKRWSDFALLLFFQSSGPLILLILFFPPAVCPLVPHVCWPFDKSYGCWNLWPPPLPVVTVEPLSYWPVHHENKKSSLVSSSLDYKENYFLILLIWTTDTAFACYRLLQLSREYRWLGGISFLVLVWMGWP